MCAYYAQFHRMSYSVGYYLYYHLRAASYHAPPSQINHQRPFAQLLPQPLPAIGSLRPEFASFYASYAQKQLYLLPQGQLP